MGKTKGSSSSRPKRDDQDEEEHQVEDLQQTHLAKFPILSHDESARFTKNKFREMVACKYIPTSLLNDVGMHDSFNQLLTNCGLKKFVFIHEHTFVDLNMEIGRASCRERVCLYV